MKTKRSRIVLASVVAVLAIAIAAVAMWVCSCEERAQPAPSPTALEVQEDADGFPYVDWDYWLSVNPDVVGWVTVPGTGIDQPIVQAHAADPTYYLKHDVFRQYNPMGVPYLDAGCKDGMDSMNAMVFGHHWSGGRVFSDFERFGDAGFAQDHSPILLQTPDWKRKMDVQAVEITRGQARTKVTDFADAEEFQCWYLERYHASSVQLSAEPVGVAAPAQVATFCTCSYAHKNDRTLVYTAKAAI